jgi:hypothetical protein
MNREQTIRVVVVKPHIAAEVRQVVNDLAALQSIVGGYIETAVLDTGETLVCNEEGRLLGLPANRVVTLGRERQTIMGTFFVCAVDGEEFASLSSVRAAEMAERFA